MRFLLDECVSPLVAEALVSAGHDAVHARDIGLQTAPDPVVLATAADDGRVLVTLDATLAP